MNIQLLKNLNNEDIALINYWLKSDSPVCSIENMTKELTERKNMLKKARQYPDHPYGNPAVFERQINMIEFAIEAKIELEQQAKEYQPS